MQQLIKPFRSILYISDSLNYFHHQSQLGNQWLPHVVKRLALQGTRKTLTNRKINQFLSKSMSMVRMDTSNLHAWEVLNWDGNEQTTGRWIRRKNQEKSSSSERYRRRGRHDGVVNVRGIKGRR
jgi:hypothetical protein